MAGEQIRTTYALPDSDAVAKAFVSQYYNILGQSPEIMYKFYQDGSRLTYAEAGPEGFVDSMKSQVEIHEKLKGLNYRDCEIHIISIDCQDSLNGGLVLIVTGSHIYEKLNAQRRFVQSFFLARQVKGYFVLNDIFRYLDEDESQTSGEGCAVLNDSPAPLQEKSELWSQTEQQEQGVSASSDTSHVKPTVGEIFKLSEKVEGLQAEDENNITDTGSDCLETTPVIDEQPSPKAVTSGPGVSIQETSEEAPKKFDSTVSYASVLRIEKNAKSPVPTSSQNISPTIPVLPADDPASNSSTNLSFLTSATTVGQDLLKNTVVPFKLDGSSVHVGNLPPGIFNFQLREELEKFGLIRPDKVRIRPGKTQGECYAFVEFEEWNAAQSAIRSSPVSFGGRKLYISQKRSIMGQRLSAAGPQPGIEHRYSSFRREDFGREGTLGGPAYRQVRDINTRFKGPKGGLAAPTVSPNMGRGFIPNPPNDYHVEASDSNHRDTEATNGSRGFSKHEGG